MPLEPSVSRPILITFLQEVLLSGCIMLRFILAKVKAIANAAQRRFTPYGVLQNE